jgi:predicted dehydrogenase
MIRVGIVGCGPVARFHHAPGLAALAEVEIVAVCDVVEENARQLGAAYGAAVYTDVERMLDEVELDVVDVVTSEGPRPPLLLTCLKRGKHVFTEKPLAGADGQYHIQPGDIPQLYPIVEEWQRQGTKFGINFNLRQSENVKRLKAAVDAGELGTPEVVAAITHMGSTNHVIDLLRWVNGEVVEVSAAGKPSGREPTRAAHLTFANGSVGTFVNSMVTDLFFQVQYLGSEARAVASNICGTYEVRSRDGKAGWDIEWSRVWKPKSTSAQTYSTLFAQSIAQFIESVKGNGEPAATGLDGLRHMEIDAAITESFETGRRVTIEPYQPLGVRR